VETGAVYEGHVFDGWYTKEDGQGTKYEKLPASEKEVEDLTLHANFIKSTYTVTYLLNGGKLKGKTLIDGMYYKESYSNLTDVELIPKSEIMYDDGVFTGWEDGESIRYTTIPKNHVGDIVVEAKYSTETTTITFNIGSRGAVEGKIAINGKFTETFNIAEDSVLPTNVRSTLTAKFNRLGKTFDMMYFDGWYTNPTCTGSPVTTLKAGNPQNIEELYAKWSSSMYMIVYHLNGGTITGIARNDVTDMSDERFVIFEDYELPKEVTHNFGTFEGWYDNTKCTGSPITKLTARSKYIKNGVAELYAKLPKTKYVVKYFVEPASGGFTQCASKVDNSASYVLDSSNFALDTNVRGNIRFDGWYKKENGEFVGNEIVSLPKGKTDDIDVYGKLVDVTTLDEEELAAFEEREAKREELRSAAKEKRKQEINDNAKKEAEKVKENMQPQNNGYLNEDYINSLIQEDRQDAVQKQEQAKEQAKEQEKARELESKRLFGAVREFVSSFGDLILGDDGTSTSVASPNEIQVKVSDLLAYDTVSAKNLGIDVPSGKVLNAVIVTYIKDLAGNFVDDYSIVGTMLPAGSNLSKVADAYPDHTFGVRAIIVDKSILTPPSSPSKKNPTYYGGIDGGGGGGGGGAGGTLPSAHDSIIVNPYGYDGRGADNGALRAGVLKLQVNAKTGRIATPSFGDYKTVSLAAGNPSFAGLADETWEYFPASNEFKLFMSAPNGDRYYLTNGWHKRNVNSKDMWYRFDSDGIMQKGFVEEGGNVYYLQNSLNELAHMVTGYKDFEGTGYTGYFRKDGALITLFPTSQRVAYETGLIALPDQPSYDRSIYSKCKNLDTNSTRILKSVKTYGQSVMGNFVGYWYYMASGLKKFRFETINTELQIARFANNGWMNIYDADKKLYSYRFDDATNVLVKNITPEGYVVDEDGKMQGNVLVDFNTIDVTKESGYVLAMTTLNTLPTNSRKLQSHLVAANGTPVLNSPATDIWTVIDFQGVEPVLTNMVYGGSSIQPVVPQVQPLQLLSNATNAISSAFGLTQTEETIPIIDAVGAINPVNIVKITKVLSNVNFKQGVKTAVDVANENDLSSLYGICISIYNKVKEILAA
jgi:glucan-binding YG repeat protein